MIHQATPANLTELINLALCLWPHHTFEELQQDLADQMANGHTAFFLAYADNVPVGFAQVGLRSDYVEGTDSSPVGYLEGIFVAETHRKQGIAAALLHEAETWSKQRGCREFASDCELHNQESFAFHLHVGFTEANRIICFTKKL